MTDELQTADKKVEQLRNALQLVSKRLSTGSGNTQGQDPAAREKRLKKLPEYLLGLAMCEASNFDDEESILKYILHECGKCVFNPKKIFFKSNVHPFLNYLFLHR